MSEASTQTKHVSEIKIFHHDDTGYGPQGKHTRREWRKECLTNILAGKESFERWQDSWIEDINSHLDVVSFHCRLTYSDQSTIEILKDEPVMPFAIDIAGHIFEDDLFLNNYHFKTEIFFSGSEFRKDFHLNKSIFDGFSYFDNCKFFNYISLEGSIFNKTITFENSNFFGIVFLRKAIVNAYIIFEKANFFEYIDCKNVNFNDDAEFKQAVFHSDAYFHETVFSGSAVANFLEVRFLGELTFERATLNAIMVFRYSIFEDNVDFKNSQILNGIYFNQANFKSQCNFQNSIFENFGCFENVKFDDIVHFEGANFANRIPSFRGCRIDSTRLEFSDNSKFSKHDSEEGAIENVSFLKRLSDEHGQTDQALRFNAIELQLKRLSPNADVGFKIVTWLYEKLSNYGQSFMRPIFGYIVLLAFSAVCAMTYSTYSKSPSEKKQELCKDISGQPPLLKLSYEQAVVEYAMFRAGGLMDFTDTGKQNNAVNCRLFEEPIEPPLMRAWGIFKGIASIALLFLAALGLRNKYRIK